MSRRALWVVNLLRIVNLLRRSIFSTAGSFGIAILPTMYSDGQRPPLSQDPAILKLLRSC